MKGADPTSETSKPTPSEADTTMSSSYEDSTSGQDVVHRIPPGASRSTNHNPEISATLEPQRSESSIGLPQSSGNLSANDPFADGRGQVSPTTSFYMRRQSRLRRIRTPPDTMRLQAQYNNIQVLRQAHAAILDFLQRNGFPVSARGLTVILWSLFALALGGGLIALFVRLCTSGRIVCR